jgi:hypothetical protein
MLDFKNSIGLFDYYKSDDAPDNSAQIAQNVDFSINGTLRARYPFIEHVAVNQSINTSAPFLPRYFWIHTSTTNTSYFFTKVDNQLRHFPIQSGIFDDQIPQPIPTGRMGRITVDGVLYVVTETTRIMKITEPIPLAPLKMQYIPSGPAGNIIKNHLDRLVVAGSTKSGENLTVYFSSQNYFDSWPAVNFLDLNAITNFEYITCIGDSIFGNLPIHTNKTTRLITGTEYPTDTSPGNISVKNISESVGCFNQETVKTVKGKEMFFSAGQNNAIPGIYEFNGVSIKERTKPYRRFFSNNVSLSTSILPSAYVYQDNYCLTVATIGALYANVTICIDDSDRILIRNSPPPEGVPGLNDLAMGPMDYLDNQAYFLNGFNWSPGLVAPGNARIYKYNMSGSNKDQISGNTLYQIKWRYKTKDYSMGDKLKNRTKTPERLYFKHAVASETQKVDITANYDFGQSSTTWTVDTSTVYKTGNIQTVMFSRSEAIHKLKFPSGASFNFINFDIQGSSQSTISFLDFYATPDPLK